MKKSTIKDTNILLESLSTLTHDIKRSYNNLHIFLNLLEKKNGDRIFIKQYGPQVLNDIDQNHILAKKIISYLKETDQHFNPQKNQAKTSEIKHPTKEKITPSTSTNNIKTNGNKTIENTANNKPTKILVVEDDVLQLIDIVKKITVVLPNAEITNCKTIEQGLLHANKVSFDIVITDYHFENEPFTGVDLIKQMQNNSSSTKYILISSHQIDIDKLDIKMDGFLTKPLQSEELSKLIAHKRISYKK